MISSISIADVLFYGIPLYIMNVHTVANIDASKFNKSEPIQGIYICPHMGTNVRWHVTRKPRCLPNILFTEVSNRAPSYL